MSREFVQRFVEIVMKLFEKLLSKVSSESDKLEMRHISAKFMQILLTYDLKQNCVLISYKLFASVIDNENFLKNNTTGDQT